jgi:hypothetical protein
MSKSMKVAKGGNLRQNPRKPYMETRRSMATSIGDVICKRMTFPATGQATASAAGVYVINVTYTSGLVQSQPATEFASFASRYQQYRVREVKLIFTPIATVNDATHFCGRIFVADYIGSASPGSAPQLLADESCALHTNMRGFSFTTTWARNPNAKLWNPTSAVIPTANVFGVAIGSPNDFQANQPLGYITLEWLVEFRGSQ